MNENDKKHNIDHTKMPLKLDIHKANSVPKPPRLKPAKKKKRRDKSDLGENFVAPDGGWGWLVAFASGICILVTFPIMQQFGILFRDRFKELGISSSQMTTIINTQQAVSACTGLFNGPLFRRFSYRQCAITGALLIFVGLSATVLADSFLFYVLTISVIYGIGRGLMVSSSSLAVNTYFKIKRRAATAYQFTVAGMGPIGLPYLSTFLMQQYSVAGAVLFYSGMSLHNLACAFIYQPVKWHVKKPKANPEAGGKLSDIELDHHQILDHAADPETPMMARANDGWYGSKKSLNRRKSSVTSYKINDGTPANSPAILSKPPKLSTSLSKPSMEPVKELPLPEEKHFLEKSDEEDLENEEDQVQKKLTICERIAIFFDLDLLRDFTFVNLAVGLTVISFTEINFAILTPFILSDFGFDNSKIAAAMSMLAACDMSVRFLIPFITAKMKFDNKYFFLGGIIGMSLGRAVVAHTTNFTVMLLAFGWMGLSKAMRVVFWNLIIPGYVPLKRLPAAAGLQLLLSGVFTLTCGPIIGLVRDATNYTFTLHWMNAMCYMVVIAWFLEDFYKQKKKRGKAVEQEVIEDQPTEEAK
ncbi:monocarboxylate transporter 7-like [Episyrphus balteatus]|uniref:monocarboxylate transporter 7-like n=1 Tax=Episyrphus balteatus TaxID=286459 RepID=UPI002486546C|nr:monocarboxylate transporter 7-like [Episyrphus balteatus]XP_055844185.1 monocarboxylate transporter 7-like [Episyrphus balteatus]